MATLAKWSIADYHKMIAAGILQDRHIQLIDGELIEMSPEGVAHAAYGGSIADYLRQTLHNLAWIREAHPITLSNSEPEPDIAIVQLPKSKYFQSHPTPLDIYWLMEISDTTLAYDLTKKREIYAAAAIPEYWVADIKDKKLTVFTQPQNNSYKTKLELATGTVNPISFPQVAISIKRLFAT
ncbi:MAG: Uma2 family endonuclease [Pleurocapsa sp.]